MDHAKIIEKIKEKTPKFKSKPSLKLITLLAFLGYVGYVNAYNLFYVPEEGKPIEIGTSSEGSESNPYQIRLFEKVSVIEPSIRIEVTQGSKVPDNVKSTIVESPMYVPPALSKIETIESPTTETKNIEPMQLQSSPTTQPTQTKQPQSSPITQPTQTKPKETPSKEIKPIQPYEVVQVLNKLSLQELKDGSVIELYISESRGEVFTILIQNGFPDVSEGDSPNEDILIWISRLGFFELQKTNNISEAIKKLASEGKISITQKANTWTLWRKGYKSLAEKLGMM